MSETDKIVYIDDEDEDDNEVVNQSLNNNENKEINKDKNYTIVHFMNQNNSEEIILRVKCTTKIKNIVRHLSRKAQTRVMLIYEGQRLKGDNLFRDIEYKDGDIIDIVSEQTGGGNCVNSWCSCNFHHFINY